MSSEVKPVLLDGIRPCHIADALDLVGDRRSLLVLREIGFGLRRANDIQRRTGAPRDRLSDRLRKLEAEGIIKRQAYCEHPSRYEYVFTESGEALTTVLTTLRIWGERHAHKRWTRVEASL